MPVSGTHSLTVPDHSPIKLGTLSAIVGEVAFRRRIDKATLINQLFR